MKSIFINIKRIIVLILFVFVLNACSSSPQITKYILNPVSNNLHFTSHKKATLLVSAMIPSHELDRSEMLYQEQENTLAPYLKSAWANAPAKLIQPLLVAQLESANIVEFVASEPIAINADYRLDTKLINFYQDLKPEVNQVKIVLSATLIDVKTQKIIMSKSYERTQSALEIGAKAGVNAYNQALGNIFKEITQDLARSLNAK